MKKLAYRLLCTVLSLLLLCGGVTAVAAADHTLSSTYLRVGVNRVTLAGDGDTVFRFKPTAEGLYRVAVTEPDAVLNFRYGSSQYVSCVAQEAVDGSLLVTCTDVGQSLLIGLSGVDSATVTITKEEGYVPPVRVVYEDYENEHTPSWRFTMPDGELTAVDITKPQTVVADSRGIYHLNNVNGPILYVNTRASVWTDLYKLFYPDDVEGEEWPPIDVMRGRYSETKGYDFVFAMYDYADAVDDDGFYYLTVDLARCMQYYGTDQGWYIPRYSPFEPIRQGEFIEESAWLVNTYYVAPDLDPGDANGDGRTNNHDLALLQRYLNDWAVSVMEDAADVNGDGRLNNRDLAELQKILNA